MAQATQTEDTTYLVTFYRRGQVEPSKVRTVTGLHESTVQVMVDEWRDWTNGTATYEIVKSGTVNTPACSPETASAQYAVQYDNNMGGGHRTEFFTEAWDYLPLAERDATWKRSDGWDYVEIVNVSIV